MVGNARAADDEVTLKQAAGMFPNFDLNPFGKRDADWRPLIAEKHPGAKAMKLIGRPQYLNDRPPQCRREH